MDPRTVDMLRRLNDDFYRRCAPSFSSTRQAPWEGWRACLPFLRAACRGGEAGAKELDLLDVACGNGRFEAFLSSALPDADVRAVAVDDCEALMGRACASGAAFRRFDALEALAAGLPWRSALPVSDAAVSFGFLHHVPSHALRQRALAELVDLARPGGIVLVSLWCFLEDERLARKAARSHAIALEELAPPARDLGIDLAEDLEPGDRFLGWQDAEGLWRYCHSFDDAQADGLAAFVGDRADEIARFRSDGKSGRLNIYLALRKH